MPEQSAASTNATRIVSRWSRTSRAYASLLVIIACAVAPAVALPAVAGVSLAIAAVITAAATLRSALATTRSVGAATTAVARAVEVVKSPARTVPAWLFVVLLALVAAVAYLLYARWRGAKVAAASPHASG